MKFLFGILRNHGNKNNELNSQIDVSDLAEGVYQFIIHNSEFTINKRLVIVR
ncbi:MAG: hypothetical protein ACYDCN_09690 [Bacteroidia bacterium]